jgi:hypothetical protein
MLPPTEEIGILRTSAVNKPGGWRKPSHCSTNCVRFRDETMCSDFSPPQIPDIELRDDFDMVAPLAQARQQSLDEDTVARFGRGLKV